MMYLGLKLLSFRDCDITARDADAILGPNDNEYFEDEYVFDRIHYTEVYKKVSLLKGTVPFHLFAL
jgi:hypothetical protein